MNKVSLMKEISSLTDSINQLVSKKSLATLDHKIKQRQEIIESVFDHYASELNQDDMAVLESIRQTSGQLITEMESSKDDKSEQIIKHKNKGSRIRLYTNIAKQK